VRKSGVHAVELKSGNIPERGQIDGGKVTTEGYELANAPSQPPPTQIFNGYYLR